MDSSDTTELRRKSRKSTRHTITDAQGLEELEGVEYYRGAAKLILLNPKVEALINVVIVINAITIGIDQSLELEHGSQSVVIVVLDQTFLVVYTLELFLRFFGIGLSNSLVDRWIWLDMLLVGTGVLSDWVLKPIMGQAEQLRVLMVLRSLRLLRLVKALKLMMKFRELCLLTQGLLSSAATMVYVLFLLLVILYCFAAMAMELVTKHRFASGADENEVFAGIVTTHFSSLPVTMLTLLQFATLDSVGAIYKPLIELDWFLATYFICVILVVSIVLMNLVAAIIINSALEQAMQDKELLKRDEASRRKKMLRDLNEMFHRVDEDGSGELSKEELTLASAEDKAFIYSCTEVEDPLEFFDMIDVDKTGAVDIDEFCEGVWQAVVSKAPIETRRMELMIKAMRRDIKVLDKRQRDIASMLRQLCGAFGGVLPTSSTESDASEPASPRATDGTESPDKKRISFCMFPSTPPQVVATQDSKQITLAQSAVGEPDIVEARALLTNPPPPAFDMESLMGQIQLLHSLVTDIHCRLVADATREVQRPSSRSGCDHQIHLGGQLQAQEKLVACEASVGATNQNGRGDRDDSTFPNGHILHAEAGDLAAHIAEQSVLV